MEKTCLLNAFSLQMLEDFPASVLIEEVDREELGDLSKYKSCIGHPDTAAVLGVEFNRVSVSIKDGDSFIVAQLQGGRLPEGSTTLPDGFSFKFFIVKVGLHTDTIRLRNSMFYKGEK